MSTFKLMMQQYEASKTPQFVEKPKISNEDRLKKYFSTYLKEGIDSETRHIRLLPSLVANASPFENVKAHSLQVGGKWEKLICLDFANGKACPFCEARQLLLNTGDESDAKLAKNYRERDMFVIRLIERGKEADGVKFWRFNKDFRNNGVFDKIMAIVGLLGEGEDITSVENGIDLIVTINRDQNGRPSVTAINAARVNTPLTNDPELTEKILSNTETWRDVYSIKPYEYLKLVVEGKTPVWSSEAKGFVSKEDLETQQVKGDSVASDAITNLTDKLTSNPEIATFGVEEDDDDVPF